MIIFDIDGTLATVPQTMIDCLADSPRNWDKFYRIAAQTKPIHATCTILKTLALSGKHIVFMTGRDAKHREMTEHWLHRHGLWAEHSILFMRPEGDRRDDSVIKRELSAPFVTQIELVFEDRDRVVNMWRELGIPCFQVAKGDF